MNLVFRLLAFCLFTTGMSAAAVAQIPEKVAPARLTLGGAEPDVETKKLSQPKAAFPRGGRNGDSGDRFGSRKNNGRRGGLGPARKEVKVKFDAVKKPVLLMDTFGGFRAAPKEGFQETPLLEIYSDGRIVTGTKSPAVATVEGTMDIVELKSLLSFIADECRFFDLSSESIKKETDANQQLILMDAPTTRFEVNLDENSNTVDVYALPQSVDNNLKIESVVSMAAIASRCRQIRALTRLGSTEEASAVLQSVNKELSTKDPDARKFTLKDLQFAEQFTDGRKTASFVSARDQQGKKELIYATWQMSADGKATTTVNVVGR